MSKRSKLNQEVDLASRNPYSSYDNEESIEATDKKKKNLLERLGLIEPVIKPGAEEDSEPAEMEVSTTLDSRAPIIPDFTDNQEKEERYNCEKLGINEIYSKFELDSKETNTIYLIEKFIKALPANLPADVKRQSILNIITVSQLDIISLLKDGNKRLEILRKYSQDFSNTVDEIIATNEKHIRKLHERIAYHNRVISEKQNVKEEQNAIIDFEIQKLSNIIEFIENRTKQ
ncbi:MAG: hypothetical protein ACOZCL_10155 [Bacillota bacterium]